jgi:S-adenosylmethionine synthetase
LGHPDTISDALAEQLSASLSRYYLEHFARILHHNVDKCLIAAGRARAEFGGGEVLEPIDIFLAGRATGEVQGRVVPVEELAVEGTRAWLRRNLPALDVDRHVRIHCLVRPGSSALTTLFGKGVARAPANDTSFGVGYAPLSPLEHLVLELERRLNSPERRALHPETGPDVKVMAQRHGDNVSITLAQAFVGRHLSSLRDYLEAKLGVLAFAEGVAYELGIPASAVVNGGDRLESEAVYLTVTGTSAEAGDDGEVGRGNRVNGLITPHRPMSLEALAGKNPVSHAGKLYNLLASEIAAQIAREMPGVSGTECYLLSEIGRPIDDPKLAHVVLESEDNEPTKTGRDYVEATVRQHLANLPRLTEQIVSGAVTLF